MPRGCGRIAGRGRWRSLLQPPLLRPPRRPRGDVRQAPPLHLQRRAPSLHARHTSCGRHLPRRAHPAASLLRPALPRLESQPRRLRRGPLRGQLARRPHRGLERAAACASHREPVLRRRRQPRRARPGGGVQRRVGRHRSLRPHRRHVRGSPRQRSRSRA